MDTKGIFVNFVQKRAKNAAPFRYAGLKRKENR